MLLGERVAGRGPEGPLQNVSGPEEDAFREAGEEMGCGHERDQAREHQRSALETNPGRRGD